jgi:hypothetical protein
VSDSAEKNGNVFGCIVLRKKGNAFDWRTKMECDRLHSSAEILLNAFGCIALRKKDECVWLRSSAGKHAVKL